MRVRNHRQRQFRFGAKRVEARCIEHNQAALQQWMRVADDGVTPRRNFDLAAFRNGDHAGHRIVFVPKPECFCFFYADGFDLDEMFHRAGHFVARIDVELDLDPLDLLALQRADAFLAFARFNRQQPDIRLIGRVVKNFSRAHGGAPDIRRQQALLEIGEEHRVDQLGFATRKLGEEGERHAIVAQAFDAFEHQGLAFHDLAVERAECAAQPVFSVEAGEFELLAGFFDHPVVELLDQEVLVGRDIDRVMTERTRVLFKPAHGVEVFLQRQRRRAQFGEAEILVKLLVDAFDRLAQFYRVVHDFLDLHREIGEQALHVFPHAGGGPCALDEFAVVAENVFDAVIV